MKLSLVLLFALVLACFATFQQRIKIQEQRAKKGQSLISNGNQLPKDYAKWSSQSLLQIQSRIKKDKSGCVAAKENVQVFTQIKTQQSDLFDNTTQENITSTQESLVQNPQDSQPLDPSQNDQDGIFELLEPVSLIQLKTQTNNPTSYKYARSQGLFSLLKDLIETDDSQNGQLNNQVLNQDALIPQSSDSDEQEPVQQQEEQTNEGELTQPIEEPNNVSEQHLIKERISEADPEQQGTNFIERQQSESVLKMFAKEANSQSFLRDLIM